MYCETDKNRELSDAQKFTIIQALSATVAAYIAEDEDVDIKTALIRFYDTPVAKQLENYSNLLYREGPGYIYSLYLESL